MHQLAVRLGGDDDAQLLDFFDDLDVFAALETSEPLALPTSDGNHESDGGGDADCLVYPATTSLADEIQSFSALLASESVFSDQLDADALCFAAVPPLQDASFSPLADRLESVAIDEAAAGSSFLVPDPLRPAALFNASLVNSMPAPHVLRPPQPATWAHTAVAMAARTELAKAETGGVERPKRKKRISSAQRQKAELSYLRAKVAELDAELEKIASNARTSSNSNSSDGMNKASEDNLGSGGDTSANAKLRVSMWEAMAKAQLEEKIRAEKENALLHAKVEGQLKFVKSLERMLRKRRVRRSWGGSSACLG